MNTYPNKSEYETALEVVKKYEKRQVTLERLAKDLSFHLKQFKSFNFKINKKEGTVIFSGVLAGNPNDKVVIGQSICQKNSKYNDLIGKLIAVKKALGKSIDDVVEHVESMNCSIAIGGCVSSHTHDIVGHIRHIANNHKNYI